MQNPNKVDKDALHTALAIATLSTLVVGLINIGLDEIKARLDARRPKPPETEK